MNDPKWMDQRSVRERLKQIARYQWYELRHGNLDWNWGWGSRMLACLLLAAVLTWVGGRVWEYDFGSRGVERRGESQRGTHHSVDTRITLDSLETNTQMKRAFLGAHYLRMRVQTTQDSTDTTIINGQLIRGYGR